MTAAELLSAAGARILSQSLQAIPVILLILGVRALVRNRWSARWQASLWVLLLVSMVVTWRPSVGRSFAVPARPPWG